MKEKAIWVTELTAINPTTGDLCKWVGPNIVAETIEEAAQYCQENGLGYLTVIGEFVEEIEVEPYDDTKSADDHTRE